MSMKGKVLSEIRELFREKYFLVGFGMFLPLFLLGTIGRFFLSPAYLKFESVPQSMPPSSAYILGTDRYGRDVLTVLAHSIGPSLYIGTIASITAVGLGVFMGLMGGYKGGIIGNVVSAVTNIFLVIPNLPLIIIISAYVRVLSIESMGFLLGAFGWSWHTRLIRAEVISLKEREFVNLAKTMGISDLSIIIRDIAPNLLPIIGVRFVTSISSAIIAESTIELIGLGPQGIQSMGWMIYFVTQGQAFYNGLWWWIIPVITTLFVIFISLQFINIGLDKIFNPRLRTK